MPVFQLGASPPVIKVVGLTAGSARRIRLECACLRGDPCWRVAQLEPRLSVRGVVVAAIAVINCSLSAVGERSFVCCSRS